MLLTNAKNPQYWIFKPSNHNVKKIFHLNSKDTDPKRNLFRPYIKQKLNAPSAQQVHVLELPKTQ